VTPSATEKRIGLLGGSFNPIHLGHLRSAVEVRSRADLASVWLVPARLPPHKDAGDIAPAEDRLRMVELAVAGVPELRAEPIELERPGPSYTVHTVRALRERHGASFALILGFEAFREIHTWHEYEALFAECDLIVTSRPPDVVVAGENATLFGRLPIAVSRTFCYDANIGCYAHGSGRRLEFLPVTALDISASAVRAERAAGRTLRFLVPDAVDAYITERGLYRSPAAGGSADPRRG